jgi:hypothetical protein
MHRGPAKHALLNAFAQELIRKIEQTSKHPNWVLVLIFNPTVDGCNKLLR